MQAKRDVVSPTKVKLTIVADATELEATKQAVVSAMSQNVKVPGFRPGTAPAALAEKQLDQSLLQAEFLDQVVNRLYVDAAQQERLRPVAPPQIALTKFVPYSTLEFTAEVEVVGEVKLADYKKVTVTAKKVEVTAKDVSDVLDNLRQRAATKVEVQRPANAGDEVVIDFKGVDAQTAEPIPGADGSDYPLLLGSKTFIPGFEDELIGVKAGSGKSFPLTFPKDYGAATLQGRKVTFEVTVHKVLELQQPVADDAFAATVGPFKTLSELKADIKKQLTTERTQEAERAYDNELLEKIAAKSTVSIPEALINEEIDRMEEEEKRNVVYRGQTWQEHLDAEGLSAEAHRAKQRPGAELRVKAGLILAEIAHRENITVTPEELEIRIMLLKNQYTDPAMQTEIDKPENRRDINSRLLTEKTLARLRNLSN